MRSSSIVLLSGGLDSLLSLHWARDKSDVVLCVTFDYGQRSREQELFAAQNICAAYDVAHKIIVLPWFQDIQDRPLLSNEVSLPQLNQADLNDPEITKQTAQSVWIPNRNGVFLNIASALAEDRLANWVVAGFNAEEGRTFPDNSKDYVVALNKALTYSTSNHVEIAAPMIQKTKKEMIIWALGHAVDLSLIWSCYDSGEKMCGVCESCQRLKRGLSQVDAVEWLQKLF